MSDDSGTMACTRIGTVVSPRTDADDTTGWGGVVAVIEVEEGLGADSLLGLAAYSHVEVLVWFDQVRPRESYAAPTHPRGHARYPRSASSPVVDRTGRTRSG